MSRNVSTPGAPEHAGDQHPEPAAERAGPQPDGDNAGKAELLADEPSGPRRPRWVPILSYVATVLVLITLNFAVPRLMPGGPIDALLAQGSPDYVADTEVREALTRYYNLGAPVWEQYGNYLVNLATGDLGYSISSNRPVSLDLRERLPWTLLLITLSIALSIVIGIPAGIHSAWKRGRKVDRGLLGFFLAAQNLPIYFVGAMVLLVFSVKLGLFPLGGASAPFADLGPIATVLDIAHHLALPVLLMALQFAAYQYLVMRSSMVSELGADYLVGGRAKGLRVRRLQYAYAGRNALLPVVTVVGMQFSLAVTSVIFIEQIFSYPGVGLYMFNAVFVRDYPAMQGAFLVLTVMVVTVNLFVDLLYRRLDPRTSA